MPYYDGTKLLSMKDAMGNTPEIYLCTTNRTGGKTTYFNRLLFNKWVKTGSKFGLIYRYNYELDDVAEKYFKDIKGLFFPEWNVESKKRARGVYHEILAYNVKNSDIKNVCGYALSLNSADTIKKMSHLFNDIDRMFFDEFQSETNHYCDDEIKKFISVHTSIARGNGKAVRYVPVYMCGNTVSIINPYYVELGISERLREDTKFLKGNGFVLEQGYVDSVAEMQKQSAFNMAFSASKYVAYSNQCVYLNDSTSFIEKPRGKSRYIATIRYNDKDFAIREFAEDGLIYCDDKADYTYPYRISVTTKDHNINYVMLNKYDMFIQNMRWYFEKGAFRFKDLRSKEAILKLISY